MRFVKNLLAVAALATTVLDGVVGAPAGQTETISRFPSEGQSTAPPKSSTLPRHPTDEPGHPWHGTYTIPVIVDPTHTFDIPHPPPSAANPIERKDEGMPITTVTVYPPTATNDINVMPIIKVTEPSTATDPIIITERGGVINERQLLPIVNPTSAIGARQILPIGGMSSAIGARQMSADRPPVDTSFALSDDGPTFTVIRSSTSSATANETSHDAPPQVTSPAPSTVTVTDFTTTTQDLIPTETSLSEVFPPTDSTTTITVTPFLSYSLPDPTTETSTHTVTTFDSTRHMSLPVEPTSTNAGFLPPVTTNETRSEPSKASSTADCMETCAQVNTTSSSHSYDARSPSSASVTTLTTFHKSCDHVTCSKVMVTMTLHVEPTPTRTREPGPPHLTPPADPCPWKAEPHIPEASCPSSTGTGTDTEEPTTSMPRSIHTPPRATRGGLTELPVTTFKTSVVPTAA